MIIDTLYLDLAAIAIIALAFFAGGLVKGVIGIGLPLVAIPIMATILPPTMAIALPIVPVVISNIWQTWESGCGGQVLRRFWSLYLLLIPTTLLGGMLLVSVDADTSALFLGVMLWLFCALQLTSLSLAVTPNAERWLSPLVGATSGFLGGASSFFSPIPVTYMVLLKLSKDEFIGTMALYYLVACSVLYIVLARYQILTEQELLLSLFAVIPLLIGMICGRFLRQRIAQHIFQRLLIIVLAIIGLVLMSRSFR